MKRLFLAFLLLAMPLVFGCKGTLQSGGAYAPTDASGQPTQAPDMAFFVADAAYQVAYNTIDAAFTFERNNRATLFKISPQIKHTLDDIRPNLVTANNDYLLAREAYKSNPTPANLSTLQTVLAKIQQLVPTVTAVLPK